MRPATAVVLALALLGGCSFMAVRPTPRLDSPDPKLGAVVYCWKVGPPLADLVGVPWGVLIYRDRNSPMGGDPRVTGMVGATIATVFASSAIYGFIATAVCMHRLEKHAK
jgi:hypothetical protein